MAAKEGNLRPTTDIKSFKDVSKLWKAMLKQICKNLGVDIAKSFGKKFLSMLFAIRWFSQHQGRTDSNYRILLTR